MKNAEGFKFMKAGQQQQQPSQNPSYSASQPSGSGGQYQKPYQQWGHDEGYRKPQQD